MNLDQLLAIWIDKKSRQELREELRDRDIYPSAFRHFLELPDTDDVDILAKVGFQLPKVPNRRQRVDRFWNDDVPWFQKQIGGGIVAFSPPRRVSMAAESSAGLGDRVLDKTAFWQTSLDHYALFGIDDLEQARTYSAPQFVEQFGSFQTLTSRYGGAQKLKSDLESMKQHLYVRM